METRKTPNKDIFHAVHVALTELRLYALLAKCPSMEFFGPNSVSCIRRGKYGSEKTPYLDTFHAVTELADRRCCVKKVFMKI